MAHAATLVDPTELSDLSIQPSEEKTEEIQVTVSTATEQKPRKTMYPLSFRTKMNDNTQVSDIEEEDEEDNSFDTFIISNFTLFSGQENVIDWLDATEKKFQNFKISRFSRYAAIPLLLEGEAKRTYLPHKNEIKSFDDLYAFLLKTYNIINPTSHHSELKLSSHSLHPHHNTQNSSTCKSISFEDTHKTNNSLDLTDQSPPHPILRSTAIVDLEATSFTGDAPLVRSTTPSSQQTFFNSSNLDQTTYVLRKALVDNLIKNPKTFCGGKEDVKQWLEDLEQLFETAQIPDMHKLDLVPYTLKGEALRWYKNNKKTITTWNEFVQELKEAFLSPFYEELAFKKLESYTQGINQSIRSFYNEVLKLCADADPTMTESTKMKHLLNKAKPTIQFEIRRKRPTSTRQFLEFAKEIEELFQLSNIDTTIATVNYTPTNQVTTTVTSARVPFSNPNSSIRPFFDRQKSNYEYNNNKDNRSNYNSKYNNNYDNNYNNNYDKYNNKNYNNNYDKYYSNNNQANNYNSPVTQGFASSTSSPRQNTPSYLSNPPIRSFSNNYSNKQPSNFQQNDYSSGNQPRSRFPSNNNNNNNQYNNNNNNNQYNNNNNNQYNNRQQHANSITTANINNSTDPTQATISSEYCTQGNETGHEASAGPRF
ncbi:unnamed protein product [Adineta steineri]|uniref:Retrotransposon gag domain-containing protein n=1 Tax=Adineta steineri TaxID=433720 RepID=A0A819E5X2_9BILA|nr:unnamed protein product [Adineta steineri]